MWKLYEAAGVNVETSHQATAPLASLLELKSFSDLKCVCVHVCESCTANQESLANIAEQKRD